MLIAAMLACWAERATAQSIYVLDGDTIQVGADRIRLWGIDAPELDTDEGIAAAAFLRSALAGLPSGSLQCRAFYRDRYGRKVALCELASGEDIACLLVSEGHATDWPRYSDGYYRDCQ